MDRERDLVVLKFREERDTLESFFKCLAERVESVQTAQTEEVWTRMHSFDPFFSSKIFERDWT